MQIRCNFLDISYLSETQKNNFQVLSDLSIGASSSEVYMLVFYLAIVNKLLCHFWLAQQ